MKILLLMTDVFGERGGIATFNRLFIRALQDIGRRQAVELDVLSLRDPPVAASENPERYRYRGFGGARLRFLREARRAMKAADLVVYGHAHFAPLALFARHRQQWLIGHGIEVWGPLGMHRRLGIQRMHRILTVSAFTRDKMKENGTLTQQAWSWFPNTIEPSGRPSAARPDLGLPAGVFMLSVSRLDAREPYKHIDCVIEILPDLLKRHPSLRYLVVGDGSDRGRLTHRVRKLGIEPYVQFLGAIPDDALAACYEACRCFVLPSEGEGFGIVFLEAMAHGKPCVGVQAGGVPEVIENGRTGFLSAPGDRQGLQASIERLLNDPEEAARLGAAGHERFVGMFSYAAFRDRLSDLLKAGTSKGEL